MLPRRKRWLARRVVLWTGFFLLLSMTGLVAAMERCHPEVLDVEQTQRLALLKQCLAEGPDQPLCLIAGTSRLALSFQPEKMGQLLDGDGKPVCVFNYSHFGATPGMTLVALRRLFDTDIRPEWIVLELVPAQLSKGEDTFVFPFTAGRDLSLLSPYFSNWTLGKEYLTTRMTHVSRYPGYLLGLNDVSRLPLLPLGGYGDLHETMDDTIREQKRKTTEGFMRRPLTTFRITSSPDRLVRACIRSCREHGAQVVVMLMPESSRFRGWYSSATEQRLGKYLDILKEQECVEVVDARTWLEDEDFYDDHHVLRRGADRFTPRFTEDVLKKLVLEKRLSNDKH